MEANSGTRSAVECHCPPPYLQTIPGILKIVEMVFCILTFAISFGGGCNFPSTDWHSLGGGWVEFSGISSVITITIWFILHIINFIPQILVNFLIEFITYCVMCVCLIISGIVAAARAGHCNGSVGAASFFAFATAIIIGVDAFLQFMNYRQGTTHTTASTYTESTTTTTVTTSASASKMEY